MTSTESTRAAAPLPVQRRRHTLSPRQRRRNAAQTLLPRRHDLSPRQRRLAAQYEPKVDQTPAVVPAVPTSYPAERTPAPTPSPTAAPAAMAVASPPAGGPRFGVADVDVTLLVDACEDDARLITAAVAASVSTSLHRHREFVGGELVELVVDGRHIARARDLAAAAIRARVSAGSGETALPDRPWIGVEDVGRQGLSHWVSPLDQGCLLKVAVGAVDQRAVVRAAASGRPAIEFTSTVSISFTTTTSVTSWQIGQLVDELRARLSEARWVAGLTTN